MQIRLDELLYKVAPYLDVQVRLLEYGNVDAEFESALTIGYGKCIDVRRSLRNDCKRDNLTVKYVEILSDTLVLWVM